jgi:hypothetical protein
MELVCAVSNKDAAKRVSTKCPGSTGFNQGRKFSSTVYNAKA